jgi:hypothetical protein
MQPQTRQAQQQRSRPEPGFCSYLAPFVSTFEVPVVGGNNHVSAGDLFVVCQLLNVHDKGSERGVSSVQHCATPDCRRAARRAERLGVLGIGWASVYRVI